MLLRKMQLQKYTCFYRSCCAILLIIMVCLCSTRVAIDYRSINLSTLSLWKKQPTQETPEHDNIEIKLKETEENANASSSNINHWAVIVSTSRYFFNYRHTANALTMYHLLRRFGIDDDHIILFLADSYACDARNPYPGAIYNNANENEHNYAQHTKFNSNLHTTDNDISSNIAHLLPYYAERRQRLLKIEKSNNYNNYKKKIINSWVSENDLPSFITNLSTKKENNVVTRNNEDNVKYEALHRDADNLYGCSAHVDYSGDDVDIRKFLEVLQGRHDGNTPLTRRLMSDRNSHILIYLAGHGAQSVLKFQDSEFLSSTDLAETFGMMHEQGRYRKIVFLADTCHAIALCEHITAPNILCLASSNEDEESYSHHLEPRIGVQTISQWMYEAERMLADADCNVSVEEERFVHKENIKGDYSNNELHRRRNAAYGNDKGERKNTTTSSSSSTTTIETAAGKVNAFKPSILHQSWFDYNYSPERQRKSGTGPYSHPAHRSAVNDNTSIYTWRVSEFMCASPSALTKVAIENNLLEEDEKAMHPP